MNNVFDYFIPPNTLGGKIKNLRLKVNIRQKQLARLLGVSRETIRRYENDLSKPDKRSMQKIERFLCQDF